MQLGGKKNCETSLRRHYPDQVCGYYLSNPAIVAGRTPVTN
jgi:hypothetical protein